MKIETATETVFLLPTESIFLTSVTLPKMNPRRLQTAIPFALEEQLTDDVHSLHFAMGPRSADGHCPVAIIAKEKMQAAAEMARTVTSQPVRVCPDIFALPFTSGTGMQLFLKTRCLVRNGPYSGFACSRAQFPTFLTAAFNEASPLPDCIHFHCFADVKEAKNHLDLLDPAPVSMNWIQQPADAFMALAIESLENFPAINLLQGEWALQTDSEQTEKL